MGMKILTGIFFLKKDSAIYTNKYALKNKLVKTI